jgi:hypothetical protein
MRTSLAVTLLAALVCATSAQTMVVSGTVANSSCENPSNEGKMTVRGTGQLSVKPDVGKVRNQTDGME